MLFILKEQVQVSVLSYWKTRGQDAVQCAEVSVVQDSVCSHHSTHIGSFRFPFQDSLPRAWKFLNPGVFRAPRSSPALCSLRPDPTPGSKASPSLGRSCQGPAVSFVPHYFLYTEAQLPGLRRAPLRTYLLNLPWIPCTV